MKENAWKSNGWKYFFVKALFGLTSMLVRLNELNELNVNRGKKKSEKENVSDKKQNACCVNERS